MRKEICKDELGYHLYAFKSEYTDNGRLYIGFEYYDEDLEDYSIWGDLTINLSDMQVESDDIIFINSYITDEILQQLENRNIIEYIDIVKYNLGKYMKYKVNRDILNEYL